MMVTMASAYPAYQQVHAKPPPPVPPPKPKKKVKFLNSVNKDSKKSDKNHEHGVNHHQHHHQHNQHHPRHRQHQHQQQLPDDILEVEEPEDGSVKNKREAPVVVVVNSEIRQEVGDNSAQVRLIPVIETEVAVDAEEPVIARPPVRAIQSTPPPRPPSAEPSTVENAGKTQEKQKPKTLPKPAKKGLGWARLRKHLIVQEPENAGTGDGQATTGNEKPGEATTAASPSQTEMQRAIVPPQSRGMGKRWDSVLSQLFAARAEHQRRKEQREKRGGEPEGTGHRAYKGRLPLLLFGPRFDARKLREAASRPAKKLATFVFDLGLARRAAAAVCDDDSATAAAATADAVATNKTFNRSARGWQTDEVAAAALVPAASE
ncbi:uncharacterized protein LOC142928917 [Petromyzon marinus]|uniref:uncharacterized protein LOC142928917 n=1 Tax=Petromyzon marinus TaxID=7757 RepID=UPI003F6FDDD7